jgi:hypothetical protein
MRVDGYEKQWSVEVASDLVAILSQRDDLDGAAFWMSNGKTAYPLLAIRISSSLADVHHFPNSGHPGFRCVGGEGLPSNGTTTLRYRGCDPASGEEIENEFVVSFERVRLIAEEFFHSSQMAATATWVEL